MARSRNYCCRGKSVSITCSECVCVCNVRYPVRNAHAPYFHLWILWMCNIFPHYLTNCTIFETKLLDTKCVFLFYQQILTETFIILRRTERDVINAYQSSRKVSFILVIFWWKLNFFDTFSKNIQIYNFKQNPSIGSRVVPYVRTDRPTWRS